MKVLLFLGIWAIVQVSLFAKAALGQYMEPGHMLCAVVISFGDIVGLILIFIYLELEERSW